MVKFRAPVGFLVALALVKALATPVADTALTTVTPALAHDADAWELTLSNDTRHRIKVAQKYLGDQSHEGQAFRNDTIMRANIEREALDLPLIDLFQAFGAALPRARPTTNSNAIRSDDEDLREFADLRGGKMTAANAKRNEAEDMREFAYLRGGKMTAANAKRDEAEDIREFAYLRGGKMTAANTKRNEAEDMREFAYLRGGKMTAANAKRDEAEDMREFAYLRGGKMTAANTKRNKAEDMREFAYLRGGKMTAANAKRNEAEDMREFAYLRGGKMTAANAKRDEAEDMREFAYLRGGKMTAGGSRRSETEGTTKRSDSDDAVYGSLLNHDSLALGAIERVNIAHRVTGKPELAKEKTDAMSSDADNWVKGYWGSSMEHGNFWTTDQVHGEPNFIEGGQVNGYGFIQSTYHKRHCLANLRMMLAWHIVGDGSKMTDDMSVHAIHCLEYIRERELANADLKEEPIDTVDYKGMGIH